MANEIRIAVVASQFEVPVVWRQPCVDNLGDGDPSVSEDQRAWCLLAAVARVALDVNGKEPVFMHQLIVRPVRLS